MHAHKTKQPNHPNQQTSKESSKQFHFIILCQDHWGLTTVIMQLSSIMQLLFDIVWNYAGTLNVFWNYHRIIIKVCVELSWTYFGMALESSWIELLIEPWIINGINWIIILTLSCNKQGFFLLYLLLETFQASWGVRMLQQQISHSSKPVKLARKTTRLWPATSSGWTAPLWRLHRNGWNCSGVLWWWKQLLWIELLWLFMALLWNHHGIVEEV